jgi:hypothetical protein
MLSQPTPRSKDESAVWRVLQNDRRLDGIDLSKSAIRRVRRDRDFGVIEAFADIVYTSPLTGVETRKTLFVSVFASLDRMKGGMSHRSSLLGLATLIFLQDQEPEEEMLLAA